MIGAVAARWDETLACVSCGSWNARWSSNLAGHSVEHDGDLTQYCRDCKVVSDVLLGLYDKGLKVRLNPDDVNWSNRRTWYHAGSDTWEQECPNDVYVHVGHKDTSLWLSNVERRQTLYTVRVVGDMPTRLISDQVDDWGRYSCGYINSYEFPGRVSLYLPKSRLEVVDKVML